MRPCLNDILNENCLLTLAQTNQELTQRLPGKLRIHDRTVARTLEGMLFRVKLARPLPAERNRPNVIEKHVDYANWFMGHAVVNHSVFIDECGYNIWTARNQGRARRGERERTGNFAVKEEEMLRSHSPFHPPMALFFHSSIIGRINA